MDILNDEFLSFLRCAKVNQLRYLLIGGYAVNYHGYSRHTADMDIWIAPTENNKSAFINCLLCMRYSEEEVFPLRQEDFTKPFVGTIGSAHSIIDILTYVHQAIDFDMAEKNMDTFEIEPGLLMNIVSYEFLKDIKLKSMREKDLFDIAQLEKARQK